MSSEDQDKSNIRFAKADYDAENRYWETIENEERKRFEQEFLLKKTCNFCKNRGHTVSYNGKITCLKLLETKCLACGQKGHTRKHCDFLLKSESERVNMKNSQNATMDNSWVGKVLKNLTVKEKVENVFKK